MGFAEWMFARYNLQPQKIRALHPQSLIPMQGPAIKGESHVKEVLNMHIDFFKSCIENNGQVPVSVPRPAQTALWYTPHPPWPLEENESL